jgi:hypothetical protein
MREDFRQGEILPIEGGQLKRKTVTRLFAI